MKLILALLLTFSTISGFSQETKKDPLIVNVEGVYGMGGIYDEERKSGGVGFGAGVWLPFKEGFIDLGIDFTSSASRNNGEIQVLFDFPFSIISDSNMEIKGYVGAGVALGRIFNNQEYFLHHFPYGPVEDYNDGGFIVNLGLELKPHDANYAFYLDAKTGVVSVPGWIESVTTPFKISLGVRFLLDNLK
jgi:hypothetical protein